MTNSNHPDDWIPQEQQAKFLRLNCREALYGGAAGGGKSDALLVDAVRYVGRGFGENYNGIIFRRSLQDVRKRLLPRSRQLYPRIGGHFNALSFVWTFPQGETISFGYCDTDRDIEQYQGVEYQFAGFDELTQFTEYQYKFIGFSRMRSACGIPLRLRATSNPGGVGHEWVFNRFANWLDPNCEEKAEPGEIVYTCIDPSSDSRDNVITIRASEVDEWNASVDEWNKTAPLKERRAHAKGKTFIPAHVWDNKYLAANGEYMADMQQMNLVDRERLLYGNWLIKPARELYFKRAWFGDPVIAKPAHVSSRIRYWDRAASGESESSKRKARDHDYTVGLLLSKTSDGLYFVENVVRFRGSPGEVKSTIRQTAFLDGKDVMIGLEEDPGQAGKFEIAEYKNYLDGFHVKAFPARQDKVTRAGPVSSQVEAGNVKIVRAPWNKEFIEELVEFPEGSHDDQVDAFSGAHSAISAGIFKSNLVKIFDKRPSIFGSSGGW